MCYEERKKKKTAKKQIVLENFMTLGMKTDLLLDFTCPKASVMIKWVRNGRRG